MKTAIALSALLVLSAAASADAAPQRGGSDCFWPSQVQRFAPAGNRGVNVRLNNGDVYHFELYGKCPDINWRYRIGLESDAPGRLCRGRDAKIVTSNGVAPVRCAVRNIRKLTRAEIRALPNKARP